MEEWREHMDGEGRIAVLEGWRREEVGAVKPIWLCVPVKVLTVLSALRSKGPEEVQASDAAQDQMGRGQLQERR